MEFDILSFLVVFLFTAIPMLLLLSIKDRMYKSIGFVFLFAFFVYSGMGLAFYEIENKILFIIQYGLATFLFSGVLYIFQGSVRRYLKLYKNIDEPIYLLNNGTIIKTLTVIYLLTFIFPFFYPSFRLFDIFKIKDFLTNYSSVPSSVKAAKKADTVYQLVCSTLRTLVFPAFFIYLYRIKNKPVKFISLYTLPVYLLSVERYYMFRSEMAVFLVFIFIYLYKEKIFSRRLLRLSAIIGTPLIIFSFGALYYIRRGESISNFSIKFLFTDLISSEIGFVNNYDTAMQCSDSVNPAMFFIYVLTGFLPMSVRSLIGIKEINLARILSESILGISYGSKNFYLILPSVLGEGIMVFDVYLAWIYVGILAFLFATIYKWVRRNDSQYYLAIFLVLDILRETRGGSQFILTIWAARMIPFMFVIFILRSIYKNKKGFDL